MKKNIIGIGVGALILFIWQFLSWGLVGIHNSQMAYTENQDAIIEALSENLTEKGTYFVPRAPVGASQEEMQAINDANLGKPWALVQYNPSLSNNMGSNMARGLIIDILAVFLLSWILSQMAQLDMKTAVMTSVAIGIIGYLSISYLNSVWFEGNTIPDLIDAIVSWGIIGAWLGWWLPKNS